MNDINTPVTNAGFFDIIKFWRPAITPTVKPLSATDISNTFYGGKSLHRISKVSSVPTEAGFVTTYFFDNIKYVTDHIGFGPIFLGTRAYFTVPIAALFTFFTAYKLGSSMLNNQMRKELKAYIKLNDTAFELVSEGKLEAVKNLNLPSSFFLRFDQDPEHIVTLHSVFKMDRKTLATVHSEHLETVEKLGLHSSEITDSLYENVASGNVMGVPLFREAMKMVKEMKEETLLDPHLKWAIDAGLKVYLPRYAKLYYAVWYGARVLPVVAIRQFRRGFGKLIRSEYLKWLSSKMINFKDGILKAALGVYRFFLKIIALPYNSLKEFLDKFAVYAKTPIDWVFYADVDELALRTPFALGKSAFDKVVRFVCYVRDLFISMYRSEAVSLVKTKLSDAGKYVKDRSERTVAWAFGLKTVAEINGDKIETGEPAIDKSIDIDEVIRRNDAIAEQTQEAIKAGAKTPSDTVMTEGQLYSETEDEAKAKKAALEEENKKLEEKLNAVEKERAKFEKDARDLAEKIKKVKTEVITEVKAKAKEDEKKVVLSLGSALSVKEVGEDVESLKSRLAAVSAFATRSIRVLSHATSNSSVKTFLDAHGLDTSNFRMSAKQAGKMKDTSFGIDDPEALKPILEDAVFNAPVADTLWDESPSKTGKTVPGYLKSRDPKELVNEMKKLDEVIVAAKPVESAKFPSGKERPLFGTTAQVLDLFIQTPVTAFGLPKPVGPNQEVKYKNMMENGYIVLPKEFNISEICLIPGVPEGAIIAYCYECKTNILYITEGARTKHKICALTDAKGVRCLNNSSFSSGSAYPLPTVRYLRVVKNATPRELVEAIPPGVWPEGMKLNKPMAMAVCVRGCVILKPAEAKYWEGIDEICPKCHFKVADDKHFFGKMITMDRRQAKGLVTSGAVGPKAYSAAPSGYVGPVETLQDIEVDGSEPGEDNSVSVPHSVTSGSPITQAPSVPVPEVAHVWDGKNTPSIIKSLEGVPIYGALSPKSVFNNTKPVSTVTLDFNDVVKYHIMGFPANTKINTLRIFGLDNDQLKKWIGCSLLICNKCEEFFVADKQYFKNDSLACPGCTSSSSESISDVACPWYSQVFEVTKSSTVYNLLNFKNVFPSKDVFVYKSCSLGCLVVSRSLPDTEVCEHCGLDDSAPGWDRYHFRLITVSTSKLPVTTPRRAKMLFEKPYAVKEEEIPK